MTATLNYTTDPEYAAPPAAPSVSITPSATPWANSAWVEVDPSIAVAWVLGHITVNVASGGWASYLYEIGIGVGAAGSETEVAALTGNSGFDSFTGLGVLDFPVPFGPIAQGSRVSVRLRKAGTVVTAWGVSLGYYASPLAGNASVSNVGPQVWPPAADGVSLTPSATPWADSGWQTLIASTSADTAIGAIALLAGDLGATEMYAELDIGIGTAGNEVVKTTLALTPAGDFWGMGPAVTGLRPIFQGLGTGVRVAIQMRKSGTSTQAWQFKATGYVGFATPALVTARPQVCYPSAAAPVTLTVSGVWTPGAWTELDPSLASAIAVTGISYGTGAGYEGDIDVGYGPSGSELVATTFRIAMGNPEDGIALLHYARNIPAGSRLCVRLWCANSGGGIDIKVMAVTSPDFTQRGTAAQEAWPDRANGASVAMNPTSWGNSIWQQIVASADVVDDTVIIGIHFQNIYGDDCEVDLGYGEPDAEVVATTYRTFGEGNVTSHAPYRLLPIPLEVPAATAVSFRVRRDNNATGANWTVALTHTPTVLAAPLTDGIYIDGIWLDPADHDALLATFAIHKSLNAVHTLTADFDSSYLAAYRLDLDQEIGYVENGAWVFGGFIMGVVEQALGGDSQSAIDELVCHVDANDYGVLARRVYVNEDRPAETLFDRAAALFAYLSGHGVTFDTGMATGPTVEAKSYHYVLLQDALAGLVTETAAAGAPFYWRIDAAKLAGCYQAGTEMAPFDLADGDVRLLGDIVVERQRTDTYANYVTVIRPASAVTDYLESWTGDGVTNSFALETVTTEAQTRGLVTYNTVEQTLSNPGGGGSWEMDDTVRPITITRVAGTPSLGDTITLVVFTGTLEIIAIADGRGSPVDPSDTWEYVREESSLTTLAEAQALADAILAERMAGQFRVMYKTLEIGLEPGQVQHIASAKRNSTSALTIDDDFLITDVAISYLSGRAPVGAGDSLLREVTAISGTVAKGDWQDVLKQWSGLAA